MPRLRSSSQSGRSSSERVARRRLGTGPSKTERVKSRSFCGAMKSSLSRRATRSVSSKAGSRTTRDAHRFPSGERVGLKKRSPGDCLPVLQPTTGQVLSIPKCANRPHSLDTSPSSSEAGSGSESRDTSGSLAEPTIPRRSPYIPTMLSSACSNSLSPLPPPHLNRSHFGIGILFHLHQWENDALYPSHKVWACEVSIQIVPNFRGSLVHPFLSSDF